jgi:hypothetical protein
VAAAGLPQRDAKPRVPCGDHEPTRQRNVGVGEVPEGAVQVAAATSRVMVVHVRTIAPMSEDAKRIKTEDAELTLEEIAELLPGTGEIMQSVGNCWWKCAYAGRGGNWGLAAYFARRTRSLLRNLVLVRPKYAQDIAAFQKEHVAVVLAACERKDRDGFDAAIQSAIDKANELHVKWAKSYLRYRLPDEPPKDLDLKP